MAPSYCQLGSTIFFIFLLTSMYLYGTVQLKEEKQLVKYVTFQVRLPEELHSALKELAAKKEISVSQLMRNLARKETGNKAKLKFGG